VSFFKVKVSSGGIVMHRQIYRIHSLFSTLTCLVLISCMQAEKVSLDTSGIEGLLIGGLSFESGQPGGGEDDGGYSGAQLVAVGENFQSWYSYDGISWAKSPNELTDAQSLQSVAFGGNLWVTVGQTSFGSCGVWTSPDGINWTQRSCPVGDSVRKNAIAYGNGIFLAAGECNGTNITAMKSADGGINWTAIVPFAAGCSNEIKSIVFEAQSQQFIAVTNAGIAYRTPDGTNPWTFVAILDGYGNSVKIQKGLTGKMLISGRNLDDHPAVWQYSLAGSAEATGEVSDVTTDSFEGFAYGNGRFVATGTDSSQYNCYFNTVANVADFLPANKTSPFSYCPTTGFFPQRITYHAGLNIFAVAGYSVEGDLNQFAWSSSGTSWTASTTTPGTTGVNAMAVVE